MLLKLLKRASTLRMAKTRLKCCVRALSVWALSAASGWSLRVFASRAHVEHLACCPVLRKPSTGSQNSAYTRRTNFSEPFSANPEEFSEQ